MEYTAQLLPVRILGDDILRKKAEEVDQITDELRHFFQDLTHTMYERDGVGLAAPQVGISKRIISIDPWWTREDTAPDPLVMLNPVITASSGESVNEEGCISVPGVFAEVVRPNAISVTWMDTQGNMQSRDFEGFDAIVVQHEIDHLDGVLFIDRLTVMRKLMIKRMLNEIKSTALEGVNILHEVYREE